MRTWALPVGATLLSVVFAVVVQTSVSRGSDVTVVSDLGQLLAAALASAGCAVGARRSAHERRRAWLWLSAGTACWAAGQTVWTFYEVVLSQEVPFPSLADVGFLIFPLVAGVGLIVWPGGHRQQAFVRGRDVMDGAIIALSLLVLSWVTVMAPIVDANDVSGASLVLSLAYPVGDVVLGTLVLLLLSRAETERLPLALLALGLGGFALADSIFSYLTSAGTYTSADLVSSSGWVTGFLFVAAAGMTVSRGSSAATQGAPTGTDTSWVWLVLPYVPLAGAGIALSADLLATESSAPLDLLLWVGLVVIVLARQFLAMIDNQRLLKALGEAGAELEHLATHDALTGLPNRALFTDRLDRALLTASSSVSVLFCDLDEFKSINDELGHAAGDQLLQVVAERLRGCVREDATVARLGGDEFAVVLADCRDSRRVAHRVVESMTEQAVICGRPVRPSISVGLAQHRVPSRRRVVGSREIGRAPAVGGRVRSRSTDDVDVAAADAAEAASVRETTAERLLRMADTAMYAAKAAGKGRAVIVAPDPGAAPLPVA